MFFHHRPQHEADQHRRRLKPQLGTKVAEQAEEHGLIHIEHVILQRIDADRAEDQDRGIHVAIGNREQLHPKPDHRQVDDQQHEVAKPHGGNQPPEQVRLRFHHARTRLNALNDQRAHHQRHHRIGWNAKREQRDEGGLRSRVIGRFGARNTFNGTGAEFMPALGDLAFHHVGTEGSQRSAAARQNAKQAAHRGAAQHGWDGPPYFLPRHHQAADLAGHDGARFGLFQIQDDFSDTEHAHGDGHKANTIGKLRNAKGEALLAGLHIGADQAERHTKHHHADGLHHRPLRQHSRDDQAEQHEGEVIRRPEG